MGSSFSSLCTDVEGVNKYIAAAVQSEELEAAETAPFRTQVRPTPCSA